MNKENIYEKANLCEGVKNMRQIYYLVGGMVLARVKKEKATGLKRETRKMIALMEQLFEMAATCAVLEEQPPNNIFQLFAFVSEMILERIKKEEATRLKKKTFKMIALMEQLIKTLKITIQD